MKNDLLSAKLLSKTELEISLNKSFNFGQSSYFYLYEDNKFLKKLVITNSSQTCNHVRYIVNNLPKFVLGKEYEVQCDKNIFAPVDCSILTKEILQNDKYYFDGEMGAIYTYNHTIFRVFSPLASECYLRLENRSGKEIYIMKKDETTGIFSYNAIGDYDGFTYTYLLKINGEFIESCDPYSRSLTLNEKKSVVISPLKTHIDFNDDKLPPLANELETSIYELSVRDFTSSIHTNIVHKSKFLGMTEKGCISENKHPVGIDYLTFLNISHVQLLPVTDFLTTNELFSENTYNWGYDPNIIYSLKGTFSDVNDPYKRIYDFKHLVSSLHAAGIRVIMDMVFNHQFIKEGSVFDKILPNYYFRFYEDGTLSNGSYCGNELETRHLMVRKYILDCCLLYVKDFHVDGFRFDLMGLIDMDTIKLIYEKCKAIRKDFMLYGEGWNMDSALPSYQRTTLNNAISMENIGFFNDRYRDNVKGKSSDHELGFRGYLLGDVNYFDPFIHCYLGSCLPIAFPPLFTKPSQSINYIECHDNATLYDKLLISNNFENEQKILKRISLMNATLIFSFGVTFIHSGQEIGQDKKGIYNSYNSGDEINGFNVELLDKRFDMARFVSQALQLKKELKCFYLNSKEEIKANVSYINYYNRAIFTFKNVLDYQELKIFINPIDEPIQYHLDGYYRLMFNEYGRITKDFFVQNITINGISLVIISKDKEN